MRLNAAIATIPVAMLIFYASQAHAEPVNASVKLINPSPIAKIGKVSPATTPTADRPATSATSSGKAATFGAAPKAAIKAETKAAGARTSVKTNAPAKTPGIKVKKIVVPVRPAKRKTRLTASVDLTKQRMTVKVDGVVKHVWPISSGRRGYHTPRGTYKPYRMHTMWRSRKYDNAKMPHSVFYSGGFAVHATYATRRLGTPASHGCVRLSPSSARRFFNLVKTYGKSRTTISITGSTPVTRRSYAAKRSRTRRRRRVRRVYRAKNYGYAGSYGNGNYARQRRRYAPAPKPKSFLEALFN